HGQQRKRSKNPLAKLLSEHILRQPRSVEGDLVIYPFANIFITVRWPGIVSTPIRRTEMQNAQGPQQCAEAGGKRQTKQMLQINMPRMNGANGSRQFCDYTSVSPDSCRLGVVQTSMRQ